MRFTDDISDTTEGSYRDECGYLVAPEQIYCSHSTGAEGITPRYSSPDFENKLPTMLEIYTAERLQAITGRKPIDLTGYLGATEKQEWNFIGPETDNG